MKIDNDIKTIMFSSELDRISISGCVPGEHVQLVIADADYQFALCTLSFYADARGTIQITQFASLLNDLTKGEPSTIEIGSLATTYVIPVTIAPKMTATEYVQRYPMSTVRGPKTCFDGSRQYFPHFSKLGKYQVVKEIYLPSATLTKTTQYDNVDGNKITTDVFTASDLIASKGYSDNCYKVKATKVMPDGIRTEMIFDYVPKPYGAKTFYFLNSFGQKESIPIALIERNSKPKHNFANIGGRKVDYLVKDETTFEIISAPLHDGEIEMAADFLRSKSVISEDGIEYVIKDGQLKEKSDAGEMWQVKATLQQVDEFQHFDGHRPKLFDDTFDKTFD